MSWILQGGTVLGHGRADLPMADGLVAASLSTDARVFDASGLIVAPGLCDVHGDGFERNISPRPGVSFPMDTAILETDRQLAANGITTAWLAMTVSWEPGLRSLDMAQGIVAALDRLRPLLTTDIRLQLRWEVYALDAVDQIETWLQTLKPTPVLAINDHLTSDFKGGKIVKKQDKYAARAGMDLDDYLALMHRTVARADEVPAAMARLIAAAERAGAAVFAHDERSADVRLENRAKGISVSEFPLSRDAAGAAVAGGEPTVLGAPNVLRGGSHIGALDAAPAIAEGLCSVLASDYYYPAPLQAVARLRSDGIADLAEAWPLVSANAARACGAEDRGTLTPGQRADAVLLRDHGDRLDVVAAFSGGTLVHLTEAGRL